MVWYWLPLFSLVWLGLPLFSLVWHGYFAIVPSCQKVYCGGGWWLKATLVLIFGFELRKTRTKLNKYAKLCIILIYCLYQLIYGFDILAINMKLVSSFSMHIVATRKGKIKTTYRLFLVLSTLLVVLNRQVIIALFAFHLHYPL